MSQFTGGVLSASTNGRGIKVVATATAGTPLHTVGAGTTGFDEIWLWATNTDSAPRTLSLEWGGVTAPDDNIMSAVSLPANSGPTLVVAGQRLNNGLSVAAFASVANKVVITGHYNRMTSP